MEITTEAPPVDISLSLASYACTMILEEPSAVIELLLVLTVEFPATEAPGVVITVVVVGIATPPTVALKVVVPTAPGVNVTR